ncbi:MAG: hypothetical protein V4696_01475 [Pseudomonadota bacterium]
MIDLPDYPSPNGASPGLVDFGAFLRPPLGGPVQRVDRMGNRFAASFTMPPMPHGKLGRIWVSRLLRGKTEGARIAWPLLDFDPGLPGLPTVNGSGQAGRSLIVEGVQPNYTFREGQPFSVITGGRHHLYFVDAEVIASGTGTATLAVTPMIRVEHLDGDECHFAKPMFEGFILGEGWQWEMDLNHHNGINFAIEEAA